MIEYNPVDRLCVLHFNSPPLNMMTFSVLEELRASIARANSDDRVEAVVIAGDAEHFSAGADIGIFERIACFDDAVRVARTFQEAFQTLEDSPKPVVAAVAGRVMGGALELASACHFRVCTATTKFSMPEVKLGFSPGAGGPTRLPRLIGVRPALKMLLSAQAIDAQEALRLGLVDAICESGDLLETTRGVLQSAPVARKTRDRTEKLTDVAVNEAALEDARKLLDDVRPELIAPQKIVEVVETGLEESFEAGLLKEQEAFAQCTDTPASKNKIYLFFATRRTSKAPELADVAPAEIRRAAVVGMGTMGSGIVQALLMTGVPVVACDKDRAALAKGTSRIENSLQRRVEEGELSPERSEDMLASITTTTNRQEIADADLVIESVAEDVGVKRSVIGRIEEVCAEAAVIATNAATISLNVLAEGMRRPERLIGMHFFDPAHRAPLVEIVRREATAKGVIATALKFAKAMQKRPVLLNDRAGSLVNRIFIPYLKEAFWLLENGATPAEVDAALVQFGFSRAPLMLIDTVGLDTLVRADRMMSRAFPRHGGLSQIAARLVERGDLGRKTGGGVYKYEEGDYAPVESPAARQIIAEVQRRQGRPTDKGNTAAIDAGEISRRLVLRMVNEAFYVMEEGIVQRRSDLDVAMVLGAGFPDFRGGPMKYALDLGLDEVVDRLDELAARLGPRFSPCKLMREMKGT